VSITKTTNKPSFTQHTTCISTSDAKRLDAVTFYVQKYSVQSNAMTATMAQDNYVKIISTHVHTVANNYASNTRLDAVDIVEMQTNWLRNVLVVINSVMSCFAGIALRAIIV
jgi:hypothetical protein